MKKVAFALIGLFVAAGLLLAPSAHAKLVSGDNSQVSSGQTIDDDLYIAGNNVVVDGTVNGDVFAAGNNVTIKGTVNGDVFAAGQDVLISGDVNGGIRAAGNSVRLVGAKAGGGVSGFAQNLNIDSDSTIGKGLNFFAQNGNLSAPVALGIVGAGQTVTINNSVGRNVEAAVQNLTLGSNAKVAGDVNVRSQNNVDKKDGAQVNGSVHRTQPQKHETNQAKGQALGIIWGLLALYVVGAVFLWAMPMVAAGTSGALESRPLAAGLSGLALLILILPIAVILTLTLIGLPLALLLLVLFIIEAYLAKFIVSLTVGKWVAGRAGWKPNLYADSFIGLIILTLVELIPGFGTAVKFIVLILGLGGFLIYKQGRIAGRPKSASAKA